MNDTCSMMFYGSVRFFQVLPEPFRMPIFSFSPVRASTSVSCRILNHAAFPGRSTVLQTERPPLQHIIRGSGFQLLLQLRAIVCTNNSWISQIVCFAHGYQGSQRTFKEIRRLLHFLVVVTLQFRQTSNISGLALLVA